MDVELPALEVLAGLFAAYDDDEFGDLAAGHPFVELGHDFLDVGPDLVVRADEHVEAIFLDPEDMFFLEEGDRGIRFLFFLLTA